MTKTEENELHQAADDNGDTYNPFKWIADTAREQKILEQIINAENELHKAVDAKWIAEKAIANRQAQLDRLHTTLKHIQQAKRLAGFEEAEKRKQLKEKK